LVLDFVYGEKEVKVLFNHFSPVIFADVSDEWSTLRTLVYMK